MGRHRVKDLVDLFSQSEGFRLGKGYQMMDDEEFPPFEEDEKLYGISIELINEDEMDRNLPELQDKS